MIEPRPPFDRELDLVIATMPVEAPTSYDPEELRLRRERIRQTWPSLESLIAGRDIEHVEMNARGVSDGADLRFSILRPRVRRPHSDCMYSIHGGGLTRGDRFTWTVHAPHWVTKFGLTLISVEYRLAPDHPHPAPVDDCLRGLSWVVDNADALDIDPRRILLGGASAGGGLAAATALLARDFGGPSLLGLMLKSPMLDDRNATISSRQFSATPGWNRELNVWAWRAMLGDAVGGSDVSPYAAPARAQDLSRLPTTFIDVGSAEVFRDEAVEFASRIWAAGGEAELHVWPGGFHGFEEWAPSSALTTDAREASDRWIGRALESGAQ